MLIVAFTALAAYQVRQLERVLPRTAPGSDEVLFSPGPVKLRLTVGSGPFLVLVLGGFVGAIAFLALRVKVSAWSRARERELEEERYRAVERTSRLKSEFLANMSHELRTPLNAIIGFAEIIHDEKAGPVTAQQKEYLGDILTGANHLLQLINDMLDLTKVESGRLEVQPAPVDVAAVVGEVQEMIRALAAEKRIAVTSEIDPFATKLVADPARLKQVLYNYLSNALKFTPAGGRVALRVAGDGSDAVRFEVEDTGIGIKPEDLDRLFVMFEQLDSGPGKQHAGAGLGLALTKRIVETLGGSVAVRSRPGAGSVFSATLPRTPKA